MLSPVSTCRTRIVYVRSATHDASVGKEIMPSKLCHVSVHHCYRCVPESTVERDRFMSPSEAKDYGLIDEILEQPPTLDNTNERKE